MLLRQHKNNLYVAEEVVVLPSAITPLFLRSLQSVLLYDRTAISETGATMRSASKHSQFFTAYRIRYFSGREPLSSVHPMAVGLTLLTGSMIAFTAAFSLEALVFSRQVWARLSVGVALAMMALLTTWCVWKSGRISASWKEPIS